ncbi:MAG: hypothetical protein US76_00195 [Parcubacteria group bacterium GW2011_GWA2_38_13b]|nr:MAG: hypothetical protein US76_00195 [Parcubacteria group bacterium GW2011_GWA2_38_13b]
MVYLDQKNYNFPKRIKKSAILKLLAVLLIIGGFVAFFSHKSGFSYVNTDLENIDANLLPDNDFAPIKDPDRLNILALGIRGVDDENGGLLTDTIMLISIKKDTSNIALISIPRDLYVYITRTKRDKLNTVYAAGESIDWGGGGLTLAKKIVSQITGQYIDYAISIDFNGFEKFIDTLGGITISLNSPFMEYKQWENYPEHIKEENKQYWRLNKEEQRWELFIDKGTHLLDGEMTLYYARARFSSNDFERTKRQQQIINAIRDKLFSIGIMANPVKIFNILDILNNHIKRDFTVLETKELLGFAQKTKNSMIIKKTLDDSENGLLYSAMLENLYVLLPVGNTYENIRNAVKNIFE